MTYGDGLKWIKEFFRLDLYGVRSTINREINDLRCVILRLLVIPFVSDYRRLES